MRVAGLYGLLKGIAMLDTCHPTLLDPAPEPSSVFAAVLRILVPLCIQNQKVRRLRQRQRETH